MEVCERVVAIWSATPDIDILRAKFRSLGVLVWLLSVGPLPSPNSTDRVSGTTRDMLRFDQCLFLFFIASFCFAVRRKNSRKVRIYPLLGRFLTLPGHTKTQTEKLSRNTPIVTQESPRTLQNTEIHGSFHPRFKKPTKNTEKTTKTPKNSEKTSNNHPKTA